MVTLHVPKMGAVNFLTGVSIRHKQLKDTVKTDRVSSVKLIMWYVCLNMSAHHGVFLNMFSNKNSVIPRCNRQSGEGRNINHPGSAFPSLVRYDLTGCQLQNSESLNSAPRSFHLRYTKQSLSPPSLFSSTWAPHWTSSHKSEPNSQLREKKHNLLPYPWSTRPHSDSWLWGTGGKYWPEMLMCGQSSAIQNVADREKAPDGDNDLHMPVGKG